MALYVPQARPEFFLALATRAFFFSLWVTIQVENS
jgi:hypothetical protein